MLMLDKLIKTVEGERAARARGAGAVAQQRLADQSLAAELGRRPPALDHPRRKTSATSRA